MKTGTKLTDQYGKQITFIRQDGIMVVTDKGYYHHTKLFFNGKSI